MLNEEHLQLFNDVYIVFPLDKEEEQEGSEGGVKKPPTSSSWITKTPRAGGPPSLSQIYRKARARGLVCFKTVGADNAQLEMVESIAHGASGVVYRARLDEQEVVAKKYLHSDWEFRSEAANLLSLQHANVVKLLGLALRPMLLILEYLPYGDLFLWLRRHGAEMTWQLAISMALNTANGLAYLHSKNLIHRDFKSSNLLIASLNPAEVTIKLMDFADTRYVNPEYMTRRHIGTVRWAAPEVLSGDLYSERADIYSIGIIFWELYTREVPFAEIRFDSDVEDAVLKGARLLLPEECPSLWRTLISSSCSFDPAQRPSSSELVAILTDIQRAYESGLRTFSNLPAVFSQPESTEIDDIEDD